MPPSFHPLSKLFSNPPAQPEARVAKIGSRWLYGEDNRLDASHYASGAFDALDAIEASPYPKTPLGLLCGKIWHPVQNQARSNFRRIYTAPEHGVPFVSSRSMFDLPLRPQRFLSRRMPKLNDLMVPEGWIVVSRSGTVGNVLYVGDRLASCAITDHAIRIQPTGIQSGYLYAFLAGKYGQSVIERGVFGATVDELEPKHLAVIPVPVAPDPVRQRVHELITDAYALRDEANTLLELADELLHDQLGITPFSDEDIEYIGGSLPPRSFAVSSAGMLDRLDASHYVPLARSAVHKLSRGSAPLVPMRQICSKIWIPARFKRRYVERDHGVPYLLPSQLLAQRPYGLKAVSERQALESPEYLLQEGQVLLTTDGTIGRVHPVTKRMRGWFGSNNMARLWDSETDTGFIYAFLATPYGMHQVARDVYGGVVDHINESHIAEVLCPEIGKKGQTEIGDLVRSGFSKKDDANELEDEALSLIDTIIEGRE